MVRELAVIVALLTGTLLATVPVAGHGNHATVDTQISENGTVVVESAYVSTDAWVVVRRNDGGKPGKPIGHTWIGAGELRTDIAVPLNEPAWENWSNQSAWVSLHRDQGNQSFNPNEDPPLRSFGSISGTQFTLAKGGSPVVTASGFSPQRSGGNVTVRRVTLPSDGYVILYNGSINGRAVGQTSLSAGPHRNVSVALNETFFRNHNRSMMVATLYADNGDGQFNDGDSLVRAGDAPVTTKLAVYLRGEEPATRTESLITTATPGEGNAPTADTKDSRKSPTSGNGPGFGLAVTVTALIVGLFVGIRRR